MAASAAAAPAVTLNVNVGILGHVDSGKTSLVRALSTQLSTAALDKHPQSQERGITLDLGFSAFTVPPPPHVAAAGYGALQFTLVDCPGHASLIRTIIGGSAIMDAMVLVVDAVKGVQTQTAECLVLAEIMTEHLVVVLNKADLLGETPAAAAPRLAAVTAKLRKVLAATKFVGAPLISLAAAPGGGGKLGAGAPLLAPSGGDSQHKPQGENVAALAALLAATCPLPRRGGASGGGGGPAPAPLLFAVDHCFPIRGQGTVLTGTVLSGSVGVNDVVELPGLRLERKVKSIQCFRTPVARVGQGDRAGLCVAGLDAGLVERALVCSPGSVPTMPAALALVKRVRFYRGGAPSGGRFHVSVGHETVMATVVFWGARELAAAAAAAAQSAAAASARADAEAAAVVDEFARLGGTAPTGGELELPAPSAGGCSAAASLPPDGLAGATSAARSSSGGGAGRGPQPSLAAAPAAASGDSSSSSSRAARRPAAAAATQQACYDWNAEYEWQEELLGGGGGGRGGGGKGGAGGGAGGGARPDAATPPTTAAAADGGSGGGPPPPPPPEWQWAALLFDQPVCAPARALVIGSRLDVDVHTPGCRLVFHGALVEPLPSAEMASLARARLYKRKLKRGVVDRLVADDDEGGGGAGAPRAPATSACLIGRSLFKKEADLSVFAGLELHTRWGQRGTLDGPFGKAGKFKATFPLLGSLHVAVAAELGAAAAVAGGEPEGGGGGGGGKKSKAADAATAAAVAAAVAVAHPDARGYVALPPGVAPPPLRPGDPLFLRYRKLMYQGSAAASGRGRIVQ